MALLRNRESSQRLREQPQGMRQIVELHATMRQLASRDPEPRWCQLAPKCVPTFSLHQLIHTTSRASGQAKHREPAPPAAPVKSSSHLML